jgi:beta-fructofuranosidase
MADTARKEKLLKDFHRPTYHFLPPKNWNNDPCGMIQWKGIYHLFYQYNPFEPFWGLMYMGHTTSPDLVHWSHKPIAMAPTPGGPDEDGVFTGCMVVNNNIPTFIYGGNKYDKLHRYSYQRPCLAMSYDDLKTLQKFKGNPVIKVPPLDLDISQFRDHCVWKTDNYWYQALGAAISGVGGAVVLYRSKDLIEWEYINPILIGDMNQTEPLPTGSMWECPDLFPLGDKHMLVISVYNGSPWYTGYFLGTYRNFRFTPESFQKLDYGDREFYAPQTFVDESGDRIQFGWVCEARRAERIREAGWAGMISLPRILSLSKEGKLRIQPHPNINTLRGSHYELSGKIITPQSEGILKEFYGNALEINVHFQADTQNSAERYGLRVLCSPDRLEETLIIYDRNKNWLEINRDRSSLDPKNRAKSKGGSFALADGETLSLQIYIDHSVIEVIANNRQSITSRIYPTSADSIEIDAYSQNGNTIIQRIDAWEMSSIGLDAQEIELMILD